MITEGISKPDDLAQLEQALDFTVVKEPLYRKKYRTGMPDKELFRNEFVDRYALVRKDTDEVIGTCSKSFEPVQMADTILRNTSLLIEQGWRIPSPTYGRRSPLRIEGNGLRAYIEMVNEQARVDLDGKHEIEKVFARFVQFNGFDLMTRFGGTAGGYQYSCSNGIHDSFDFMGITGHRHIGRGIAKKVSDLSRMAEVMLENFELIAKGWRCMSQRVIAPERGLRAIESVSLRDGELIVSKLPRPLTEDLTAWDWFSAITNYLTFEFAGSNRLFNAKQENAKAILMGDSVIVGKCRFLDPEDKFRMNFSDGALVTKRGS